MLRPLRGWAQRKAALLGLRLVRFALFADGAHEPDIVPRQEYLHAFRILAQSFLVLQTAVDLLPPLVLAVRPRLEQEGRREAKRGLLLAPVGAAGLQDGGGRGRFAREGEFLVREFRRARRPSGAVSWMDVDSLERLSLWCAAEILQGKLGTARPRVVRGSFCTQWAVVCGVGAQNAFDDLGLAVRAHTLLAHDRADTEGRRRGGQQGISLAIDRNQSKGNKGKRKETLTLSALLSEPRDFATASQRYFSLSKF